MGNMFNKKKSSEEDIEEDNIDILHQDIYIPPLTNYKYFNRRMPYLSEKKEITESEQKKISKIMPEKIEFTTFPEFSPKNSTIKIIIDTDLGTDWDDAMAIMYALNIPHIEILGITTNYGIPKLRAKVVQKIIDAYEKKNPENKNKIKIIPGASRPLGTHRELMIYGHEGLPFFEVDELKKNLGMKFIMNQEQENAAKFIVEQVKKYPNEIKIVSIGIPTNIGLAIKNNPEIIPLIKEIIIMGCGSIVKTEQDPLEEIKKGKLISLYPNHNVSGDSLASKILFDANIPTKIVSHTVSSKFWSEGKVIDFLRNKANEEKDKKNPQTPEGGVGLLMNEWFRVRNQNGQCPHDPLTINEAAFGGDDSPIIYARGYVLIHEWAAFGTFIPRNDGPHYLGVEVKKNNNFLNKLEKTIIGEEEV
jgi:purine nucleosidase